MKTLKESIEEFVEVVNEAIAKDYKTNYPSLTTTTVSIKENRKYFKLLSSCGSVWGFIVKENGVFKNTYIKTGDLLKAATFSSPAKGNRGNILDGNARWNIYGPSYNN